VVHALLSHGAVFVGDTLHAEIEFVVADEILGARGLDVTGQQVQAFVGYADSVVALGIFVAVDTDKPIGMAEPALAVSVGFAGRIDHGVAGQISDCVVARLDIGGSWLVEAV
jgi:hypothetical protein